MLVLHPGSHPQIRRPPVVAAGRDPANRPSPESPAAVVLLIVGVAVIVLVGDDGGDGRPAAARTSGRVAPPPVPSAPETPSDSPTDQATPASTFKPAVPGWQVAVASSSNGLSYDVPPSWKINDDSTSIGLDDGNEMPETTVSFSAESRKDRCVLGGAGFHSSKVDDLGDSVLRGARLWAKAATYKAGSPQKTIGSLQNITLKGLNRVKQITARVTTAPDADNCGSTGTTIHIVAIPVRGGGSLLFVLYVHPGQPGAMGDSDMDKMVHSVRLAK